MDAKDKIILDQLKRIQELSKEAAQKLAMETVADAPAGIYKQFRPNQDGSINFIYLR